MKNKIATKKLTFTEAIDHLIVLTQDKKLTWKFPDIPAISDLYMSVIEQIVGIEGYFKDFISDEDITQDYKENGGKYRKFINYLKEVLHV